MPITIGPDNFPWDRRVVSMSPHSEDAQGAITGRGFSDRIVFITWDVPPGINPGLESRTWHSVGDLEWLDDTTAKAAGENG
ncbi:MULTISPECIES: hypothetical protein [unclassified Streptomyces]|uniref:hypothetical protein n=1 Tax=unclassified Streptomyces TaxID=2593676 RepID=UPI0022550C8D|nr:MULTISPECIES: hypothetical protein [unclassified Streptomyces]MCX4405958.1 hypothetical protein [Streptomyces sp. NBC_01764]MCX5189518.1 hypothetical protein [Streptomyces sp. NBC_00268]